MIKLAVRYTRYALSLLASIAFSGSVGSGN